MTSLEINGNDLSFEQLRQVVYERRAVAPSPVARTNVVAARDVNAHAAIRKVSAKIEKDRVFAGDFQRVAEMIAAGRLAE